MTPTAGTTPVLLFDGECGVCSRSVQFVLQHESPFRTNALRFARLQGEFAESLRGEYPMLATVNSALWLEYAEGSPMVYDRSDAVLRTLRHIGGVWGAIGVLGSIVPRSLRDWCYDQVAVRRQRLAAPRCLIPDPADAHRFLP